jgi:hypothetical protein
MKKTIAPTTYHLESCILNIPSSTVTNDRWRFCIPVSQEIYTSHTENHSCTPLESLLPISLICKQRKELNKIRCGTVLKKQREKTDLSFSSRFSCFKWTRASTSDSEKEQSILSTSPTCQLNSLNMISINFNTTSTEAQRKDAKPTFSFLSFNKDEW